MIKTEDFTVKQSVIFLYMKHNKKQIFKNIKLIKVDIQ